MDKADKYEVVMMVAIGVVFASMLFHFTAPVSDPDFWWHLASGRWMWENGTLLEHDPFSIPFNFQEPPLNKDFILRQYWLSQILFYAVYSGAGLKGVIVFCASIFTFLFYLLYRLMRMGGTGRLVSILFVYLATSIVAGEFGYIGARPQMWSSLFTVLIIYLLELLKLNRKWTYAAIPALLFLWSNMHGGYILGDIIILIYIAGALLFRTGNRTFYLVTGAALLLSGLNPNGYRAFISAPFLGPMLTSLHITSQQQLKSMMDSIVETQSIFEHASLTGIIRSLPLFSGLIALSLLSFSINVRNLGRMRKDHILLYILVLLMGLRSIRFIIFFVTIASFLTVLNLKIFYEKLLLPRLKPARSIVFIITLLVLSVLSTKYVSAGMKNTGLISEDAAISDYKNAVSFMKQNRLQGNIFDDYNAGGYLIWHLYPEVRVFIDGRALYRTAFEIFRITVDHPDTAVTGWNVPYYQMALNSFNINLVLISGCDKVSGTLIKLAPALIEDKAWALIYADGNSLLFMRDMPENRAFLMRRALPKTEAYKNILSLATEAAQSGHARMMPNWKLSLATANAGLGNTAEARRWLDDYLHYAPSDAYASALKVKIESRTP